MNIIAPQCYYNQEKKCTTISSCKLSIKEQINVILFQDFSKIEDENYDLLGINDRYYLSDLMKKTLEQYKEIYNCEDCKKIVERVLGSVKNLADLELELGKPNTNLDWKPEGKGKIDYAEIILGKKVLKLFGKKRILKEETSLEKIEIIGEYLDIDHIKALGVDNVLNEKMSEDKMNLIGSNMTPKDIQNIGAEKITNMTFIELLKKIRKP